MYRYRSVLRPNQLPLSLAHLALVVAAFLRNASIGQVNLNSMSEVTGASTSRLQEAGAGQDEAAEE